MADSTKEGHVTKRLKRIIGASYMRDNVSERIRYAPGMLPDGSLPPFVDWSIKWQILRDHLNGIRNRVKDIANTACLGHKRGEKRNVEPTVLDLSKCIFPPGGFVTLLEPNVDPEFDSDELLSSIPWELFEERYLQCQKDPEHIQVEGDISFSERVFCSRCGAEMIRVEGKLGICRTVSHVVRPFIPRLHTTAKEFLIVADPTGDICRIESDPNGICQKSIKDLFQLLGREFEVMLLGAATRRSDVLRAIKKKDLAGIYFFGHGDTPAQGGEGSLLLADGPLFAHEIVEARTSARIIFLNACWSADTAGEWTLDRKFDSIAHAFAQGLSKTVIGSMWPLVNTQAATSAVQFFKLLVENGQTVAEAMRCIREQSLQLYSRGEADISWMSYRLFGDPSQRVKPSVAAADIEIMTAAPGAIKEVLPPLFDQQGNLITDMFSFPIDEVLLRAAKRRNLQQRLLVSLEDFVAGMLRKGDLTRFLCIKTDADPDFLYDRLQHFSSEPAEHKSQQDNETEAMAGNRATSAEHLIEALLDIERWIVRQKGEFELQLLEVLEKAHRKSSSKGSRKHLANRVTERAIIETLLTKDRGSSWKWLPQLSAHLPAAPNVHEVMKNTLGKVVDDDGCVIVAELDADAKKVVEKAHTLAQQRGVSPIPNRLMMAAFLSDQGSYTFRLCAANGIDADTIRLVLLAATEGKTPQSFPLSYEACQRILWPLIQKSKAIAANELCVTERELFNTYCEVADPRFKELLKSLFGMDLDRLKLMEPQENGANAPEHAAHSERLPQQSSPTLPSGISESIFRSKIDKSSWGWIQEAAQFAHLQGWTVIRSPHLFAGMIGDGQTLIGSALRRMNVNPLELKNMVLSLVPPRPLPVSGSPRVTLSEHVYIIVRRAIAIAAAQNRDTASGRDLFAAFFEDGGGVVGELLGQIGLSVPSLADGVFSPAPH